MKVRVTDETTASKSTAVDRTVSDPVIEVRDLSKTYGSGDDAVAAVRDVSFTIEPGTCVGILGPNGAGKTTLIKILLGLIVPDSGRVQIEDTDVHTNLRATYQQVGGMLEGARNSYWRLTVRENLRFFAMLAGHHPAAVRDRHTELLEKLNLESKADTPVRELSRGMKQKVSLASTLARGGSVGFLDEPTLGLDVEASFTLREELSRLINEENLTILLSSHDMDVIEDVCDRVIILNDGKIITDDSVESLLGVFDAETYRFTLESDVGEGVREELTTVFDVTDWHHRSNTVRFEVTVSTEEFYQLVEQLRTSDCSLVSIDSIEPNLEEIFLELTQ